MATERTPDSQFLAWLFDATNKGASDIHLISGDLATMRLHGELLPLGDKEIELHSLTEFLRGCCDSKEFEQFINCRNLDVAIEASDPRAVSPTACRQRFRVNLFSAGDSIGACFRVIPSRIPDLSWANFPLDIVERLCGFRNGLVVFSGVTGSGKTTSMAMLINEIVRRHAQRVVTIEDPIEYVLSNASGSLISQRQVGRDVGSFAEGLKFAVRQDPNLILVGEIRDEETARMALSAAETGHLVLTTLHTRDAKGAVTRLIDLFPSQNHAESCSILAIALRAVICQHLLPSVFDGEKRELALEVMYNTHPVAAAIRTGRFDSLDNAILAGRKDGMISLDESVRRLYDDERIDEHNAARFSSDPQRLNR